MPHCSKCAATLANYWIGGFFAGGASAATALAIAPPTEASLVMFCYILFGYPAFPIATTMHKALLLGKANREVMCIRVKRPEYLKALASVNPTSSEAQPATS